MSSQYPQKVEVPAGRTSWVPGQRRDPRVHGKRWSKADKDVAIDSVVALIMEGYTMEGACKVIGMSGRTFEKWRQSDPDLNETVISIIGMRPGGVGRDVTGKWHARRTFQSPMEPKIKKVGDDLIAQGKIKEAWLYYYDLMKDRVYACKVTEIAAKQIVQWFEEDKEFASAVEEIETKKQWMVEDILWRRGVIFKDASALRVLLANSKVGSKKSAGQKSRSANIAVPSEVHFHISQGAPTRVAERLEDIFSAGDDGPKQLPDSTESVGLHSSGHSSGGDGPAGADGNGKGALHQ